MRRAGKGFPRRCLKSVRPRPRCPRKFVRCWSSCGPFKGGRPVRCWAAASPQPPDDDGGAEAQRRGDGYQGELTVDFDELIERVDKQYSPARAQWVAGGHRSAPPVDLVGVELELIDHQQHRRREGFV